MKKELGILVLLVALCAAVALRNPQFLSVVNLQNVGRLVGIYGIFGIGVGIVIITGGIDLSVGSLFALQGVLLAMMLGEWGWPWPAGVAAVIAGSAALGWGHGALVSRARLQPFVVTLCGLLLYRGLARYVARDETKGFGTASFGPLRWLASGDALGVPTPLVLLLVVAVVVGVVLHGTAFGRYLYAVGRNEEAARYSGIDTRRVVTAAYVLSAALAGVAGILLAFYTNSVSASSHGSFYELYAIAAAVVGGCALRGGEGSVVGIVIGTALLQVLRNLVNLLGIPSSLDFAVMGGVILVGSLVDQALAARRARPRAAPVMGAQRAEAIEPSPDVAGATARETREP